MTLVEPEGLRLNADELVASEERAYAGTRALLREPIGYLLVSPFGVLLTIPRAIPVDVAVRLARVDRYSVRRVIYA